MRTRFILAVIALLVLQALLLAFLRGSPELTMERSFTATPTITPLPLPPTAVPPTRIPTLVRATMVAPAQPANASTPVGGGTDATRPPAVTQAATARP